MNTHPSKHPNPPHNKVKLFSVLFYQWQAEILTEEGRRWAFRDSFSLFLSLHPFISYQDTSIISLTQLINRFCHSVTFVKSIFFTVSKYSSASSWFGRLERLLRACVEQKTSQVRVPVYPLLFISTMRYCMIWLYYSVY